MNDKQLQLTQEQTELMEKIAGIGEEMVQIPAKLQFLLGEFNNAVNDLVSLSNTSEDQ